MQCANAMIKSTMHRGWVNQSSGAELSNVSKPLKNWAVDDGALERREPDASPKTVIK
jgi:hypothetical protein